MTAVDRPSAVPPGRPDDRPAGWPRAITAAAVAALLAVLVLLAGCGAGAVATPDPGTTAGGAQAAAASGAQAAAASCPAPSPTAPGAADSRLPVRSLCALPSEAGQVWRTISQGGRLAYPKDGSTFGNHERRLPLRARGYYREYTVPTPGSRDRGARRLVTGERREVYYTGDHYDSFVVVDATATGD